MKKIIFLVLLSFTQIIFASTLDKRNAKIGSTIMTDYSSLRFGLAVVGHAAVVINEYENDFTNNFAIGAEMNGMFRLSFNQNLNGNTYLGHFRAVSQNYTKQERKLIKRAVERAVNSNPGYEFINLYTYDLDFEHENNIPYSLTTVPTDFRCDGLAEWAIEVATKPANPTESDGFYSYNNNRFMYIHEPIDIIQSPIDAIGTPDAPTLALTDTDINASFAPVSGAWSEALYALYRSTVQSPYVSDLIYCGKKRSYKDEITDDMEGEYFYYLKIGERTASCNNAESDFSDFSEFSEYSSVLINKCKSPELFEVVSQTDVNTSDWRVSVKNLETNETQEGVLPFNLNGSLYQLDNDEWVLASCDGKAYTTTWEGSQGIYQLDNLQGERIVFDRFEFSNENNLTIIDNKTSLVWNNTDLSKYSWSILPLKS